MGKYFGYGSGGGSGGSLRFFLRIKNANRFGFHAPVRNLIQYTLDWSQPSNMGHATMHPNLFSHGSVSL